jgi:hypothetical protein
LHLRDLLACDEDVELYASGAGKPSPPAGAAVTARLAGASCTTA